MADARAFLPFFLIALGGRLPHLLALPAVVALEGWLRHGQRMHAGDATKERRPPGHPSS